MKTKIERIDLGTAGDLEKAIQDLCTVMAGGGYKLVTSFTYQEQLVLIFQA
jgi:hypothetical protein